MLKPLHERARNEAEEFNERVVGPLTRIVRADANFSGQSQEKVFNAWKEQLWPDEEPAQEGGQSGDVADEAEIYKKFPDGAYTDSRTNKRFTITNGIRAEDGG